jgi:pimeloyl-ACP methyl ester carboxylesterase
MLARTSPGGYIACCEALRDADLTAQAAQINIPALVESSARLVPGSRFEKIGSAAHIPCVERPTDYAHLLKNFAAQ